jgi:hypothetical protein
MIWLLAASTEVPLGGHERVIFNHPSSDRNTVTEYVRRERLGTPRVRYQLYPIPAHDTNELVLCVQRAVPVISPEAVQAAQNAPRGQQGQNRNDSQPDHMGFAELGDAALPLANDESVYGETQDGTYSDLVRDGAAMHEVRRTNQ